MIRSPSPLIKNGISNLIIPFIGAEKDVNWEKIRAIKARNNSIEIKNSIGLKETIPLPIHTNKQMTKLRNYLFRIGSFL